MYDPNAPYGGGGVDPASLLGNPVPGMKPQFAVGDASVNAQIAEVGQDIDAIVRTVVEKNQEAIDEMTAATTPPGELLEGEKVGTIGLGSNWPSSIFDGSIPMPAGPPKGEPMSLEERMRLTVLPDDPQLDLEEEKKILAVELTKLIAKPYVELHKYRSSTKESMANLEDAFKLHLASPDTFVQMNNTIQRGNPFRKIPTSKIPEKYHELHRHATLCLEAVENVIERVRDSDMPQNSVSFLSYSMGKSCEKRIAEAREQIANGESKNPAGMERYIQRTTKIMESYMDRTQFQMLFDKLQNPIVAWEKWHSLESPEIGLKKINRVLSGIFQDPNMAQCRSFMVQYYLNDTRTQEDMNHAEVLVFFTMYWLACVYETEYESGKCAQVKTFLTNVYDAFETGEKAANFDIPGGVELFGFTMSTLLAMLNPIMANKKADLKREWKKFYDERMTIYRDFRNSTLKVSSGLDVSVYGDTSLVALLISAGKDVTPESVLGDIIEEIHCLHVHQRSQEQGNMDEYLDPDTEVEGEVDPDMDVEHDVPIPETDEVAPEGDNPSEPTESEKNAEVFAQVAKDIAKVTAEHEFDFDEERPVPTAVVSGEAQPESEKPVTNPKPHVAS